MAEETPPAQPTYEQVKADIKGLLLDMGLEIVKEFETDESCGFWTKFGDFPVLIENRKPLKYCMVAFQFTFSEGAIVQVINEHYDRKDHEFIFRLTQALTSPQTSFIRVLENGRVIGFTVMKSIYPFHAGFSICDLDRAIQAVTSVGAIGIAFLKSEVGPMSLNKTPQVPSGPGPMYG